MTTRENRRHYRVDSQNLLNYVCYDDEDNVAKQGMGRTLNVSETGMLLETHIPIDRETTVGLTIGLEEDLIDLRGLVVFAKAGSEGKFESGIEFQEMDEAGKALLKKYVAAFQAA